ncbi:MAG: hypothetical protein JSV49_11235 [Thermoplasmata archaeon]|nr:MAG: hypothetical protein JSV49_11235 [Thermoplasmata archaeon]
MPKCPICQKELKEKTEDGWLCECGELIPHQFSDTTPSCGCGCNPQHHH